MRLFFVIVKYAILNFSFFCLTYYIAFNFKFDLFFLSLYEINSIFSVILFFLLLIKCRMNFIQSLIYIILAFPIYVAMYFFSACSIFKDCI